jgi:tetratricopeptide (TPR) repeat protein
MKAKLALLIFAAAGTAQTQSSAPEFLLSEARAHALEAQIARLGTDERIQFLRKLIVEKPEEPRYQNLLALAGIQKTRETQDFANLDRAAQIINAVLAKNPANYEALRIRSQIYLERHEFQKAVENSLRLTKSNPHDPYNYGALGDALMELGEYDRAADAFQKMVDLKPDLSSYNRASYYRYIFGDARGAIELMRKAIRAGNRQLPENQAWCLAQLGNMLFQQGDLQQANLAYGEALRLFPNHYEALAGLGKTAAARGEIAQAIDYMKRSVTAVPLVDNVALLADYYEIAGEKREAGRQWRLVEFIDRLAQVNQEVYNRNLAVVYSNHDLRPEKALELARRELDVRGDVYTWDALAWACYKNRKYSEAEQAMEKAMRPGTPDPMLYYHAGMIARAVGKNGVAKERLARALALNPRFDARQAPLAGRALRELEETEKAHAAGQ